MEVSHLVLVVHTACPRTGAAEGSAGGRRESAGCWLWQRISYSLLCQDGKLAGLQLQLARAVGVGSLPYLACAFCRGRRRRWEEGVNSSQTSL